MLLFFKEKNNILKPNKIKTALSFKARSVELAAQWLTPVFSIFSVLRTLTGNGQPGDTMKGNSAVKVSLITCDLKSVNGPNGHSLTQAKAYNNPKAPLKSCHKSTGRMVLDTGGRAEYFPTNKWATITDTNIKILFHSPLYVIYICPKIPSVIQ